MKVREVYEMAEGGGLTAAPPAFQEAMENAVANAWAERDITLFEYWRLKAAMRRPRTMSKIYAGVLYEAVDLGELLPEEDAYAVDWNNFIDFLERLMGIILRIIALF